MTGECEKTTKFERDAKSTEKSHGNRFAYRIQNYREKMRPR